jgi:four helix bundle protein
MTHPRRQDLVAGSQVYSNRALGFVCDLMERRSVPGRIIEQVAGSTTGIGANLSETRALLSRKQMAHCYNTSLRESHESIHWMQALQAVKRGDQDEVRWLLSETREFAAILSVSVRHLRLPPDNG